jgi:hypothetical protein
MKISPELIELGDARRGLWSAELPSLGYNFHYRRPFLRPHSISLGAHGTVETIDPAFMAPSEPLPTVVTIQKSSNPDSIRNKEHTWTYMLEDLESFYGEELLHGDEAPEVLLARMAVCESIEDYSKRGIGLLDVVTAGVFLD